MLIFLGYTSIPVAILCGYGKEALIVNLDAKIPAGPLAEKWDKHKFDLKLVNPANKRKFDIIVVGTGLAGASAAASLAELGYKVKCFCFQDSPRRAHSIAAQGGINAAKNYQNDGDSVYRLFYDTIKGGDFRAREANVYRLAQVSVNIIDQCVAQGVPFAREYGGLLANRSFGGAQVSRTFYARGQTGQQLLLGAYQALCRQIGLGTVQMFPRTEMLDLVVIDGHAKGIVVRDLITGEIASHAGDAVVLATGGYGNVFFLSTNAKGCNVTATWRAYKKGAFFANPCYTQIHPTCIPVSGEHQSKLTLMSESLRNDGRVWVPKRKEDCGKPPGAHPRRRTATTTSSASTRASATSRPRDISSRAAKEVCDEGRGVGPGGRGVYLDFADAIKRLGENVIRERYGNLFDMYEKITGENAYQVPMRIYPGGALHHGRLVGGLQPDEHPARAVRPRRGELLRPRRQPPGRQRADAGPGRRLLRPALHHRRLPRDRPSSPSPPPAMPSSRRPRRTSRPSPAGCWPSRASARPTSLHRELGKLLWENCGMARNEAGLKEALKRIPELREEFWKNVNVTGESGELNQSLEYAGRVADFLEFAELLCLDALHRRESCGGHFREEFQTPDGEAQRDDENFAYVAAWEYQGADKPPVLHKEPLVYEEVHMSTRSYK